MIPITEIQVPTQPKVYRYLSEWPELCDMLPPGKFILNKGQTGCGGTTLFLNSQVPLILISPRSNMLYSKAAQFPNVHLYRGPNDKGKNINDRLKSRLSDYILNCINRKYNTVYAPMPPKILVTPDSYKHVAECLKYMGQLQNFNCLVDEFHCLISDCKFKAKTELEFLYNLRDIRNVCFMSATPIPENYIDQISYFSDITSYIQLKWDKQALEIPNVDMRPYKAGETIRSICRDKINEFRQNGYFERKQDPITGKILEAKEAVFFINEVDTIYKIIIDNQLNSDDVNVLCSASNSEVQKLKKLGVHVGELCIDRTNPANCPFMFCTRASFDGVDFYSNSAFTYIFSDGVLDWHRHDLIIDVPQILGRQRLQTNPFWKDAIIYYRADSKRDLDKVKDKILQKEAETDNWFMDYNSSSSNVKLRLCKEVRKRAADKKYEEDYVEVVDDLNGGFLPQKNELLKMVEIRDYDLAANFYSNPLYIVGALINQPNINVTNGWQVGCITGDCEIDNFNNSFFKSNSFPDKMASYIRVRQNRPEYTDNLYQNYAIDIKYHQFYDILGTDVITKLRFREKDLEDALLVYNKNSAIIEKCRQEFIQGKFYTNEEVKAKLQTIYDSLGIRAKAKANELKNYIMVKPAQKTITTTGERPLGFWIL